MVRFFEHIDKIIYINLDNRKDRKREMMAECRRLQIPEHKIIRFPAIRHHVGAIGCSKSHIEVLNIAIKNNWKNYMVLEDDFHFINDTEFVDNVVNHFFESFPGHSWDVLNCSRGYFQDCTDTSVKYVQKVLDVSTTSCYIVNQHFYQTLLHHFIEGYEQFRLDPNNHSTYAIDRYWTKIMPLSNWYITNPSIGYQRTGLSSILGYVVNYIQFDKTLNFDKIPFIL
jgi:glycosyl transferase family 25